MKLHHLFTFLVLSLFITFTTVSNTRAQDLIWPQNELTAGLPAPTGTIIGVKDGTGPSGMREIHVYMKWTAEEGKAYGEQLIASGVPLETRKTAENYSFSMIDNKPWNGRFISVAYLNPRYTPEFELNNTNYTGGFYQITIIK
jgi:hypothetical protein